MENTKAKKATTKKTVEANKKVVNKKTADKIKKLEKETLNNSRFSLVTVIVLLLLIFIPVIMITTDMKYTYFRDNIFTQDFFTADTSINDLAVMVGYGENQEEKILETKDKTELLKLLSNLKIRKQKLIQTDNEEGVYVNRKHTYVRIVNLKTEKTIKVKVEGILMEVQGYSYLVDDSLKTAEINIYIDNLLSVDSSEELN